MDEPQRDLWDRIESPGARVLVEVAVAAFAENGFHATTTRELAERAGLSPAAVYFHYATKADLLLEISAIGHRAVLSDVEAALAVAEASDPVARMRAFVVAFTRWHAQHHTAARVIQYELDALPRAGYAEIRDLRRSFDGMVDGLLAAGVAGGAFAVTRRASTARAILSLGIDVARWYQPGVGDTPEEVGALYGDLVLRMLQAREA